MHRFKISTDTFHQEYVDIEPVRRLADIAHEILGPERVLVRWQKYLDNPVGMKSLSETERAQQYINAINDYPCRLTGRAAGKLAELIAAKSVESFAAMNCTKGFLSAKGVHIDAFGNVFSGTCSGIIVGNVNRIPLENIWKQFDPAQNDFIKALFHSGPYGLLPEAEELGYKRAAGYASKCHLCTSIRQFFLQNGLHKTTIGPAECYCENIM
jgi:hypothetical protein